MWERIREIIRKEFRQTLRDPRMRVLLIGPPILQLIIFGYAVNLDVEHSRLAWVDMDRSQESRELLAAFEGSAYFEVAATPSSDREVQDLIDHSVVLAAVRILPGFGRDVRRGNTAGVQILLDGTNSNTAAIVSSYASQIVVNYAARLLEEQQNSYLLARASPAAGAVATVAPEFSAQTRVWFNPALKSRDYFVPGVVMNIIALVTVMLTSMSIVREKEIGTMEQLMVTPIRPIELMLGKVLPFAAVGLFEVGIVTAAALLVFRTPFRGNPLELLACAILFLLTTLGTGLFISTISDTQQQAMMSSFFFFLPAMLLSGFSFPIPNMPAAVQYLTYLNPLRYFMQILRGIFLKGIGTEILWPQMLALASFGVAIIVLSALRFHKRLD
jgi:ABC-2 type transport system permease protein